MAQPLYATPIWKELEDSWGDWQFPFNFCPLPEVSRPLVFPYKL